MCEEEDVCVCECACLHVSENPPKMCMNSRELTPHGCVLIVHHICLCNPRRHLGSLHKLLKHS